MFNLNYAQNSLQALPFHDLDDREFHILNGSCHLQIDNLKNLDLYNLLPNPDESDGADPDHIAKSFSFLHCNIKSLSKNIGLLEDMLYSLSEQPDVLGVSETRLNATGCKENHFYSLKLTFTSLNIISTSPENVLMSRLISQFFCNLNSSKNFTCPSGKIH